jgi:hypothetical protein
MGFVPFTSDSLTLIQRQDSMEGVILHKPIEFAKNSHNKLLEHRSGAKEVTRYQAK